MDINKRWETMPNTEQEELVAKLTERQKLPWKELTQNEKQAAWYISYGEWGPRRPVHAKGDQASFHRQGCCSWFSSQLRFLFLCKTVCRRRSKDYEQGMANEVR